MNHNNHNPYTHIHAVFNDTNLYMCNQRNNEKGIYIYMYLCKYNITTTTTYWDNDCVITFILTTTTTTTTTTGTLEFHPNRLRYDFHVATDWIPLISEDESDDYKTRVQPHYPVRGLTGVLPEEVLLQLEEEVQNELEVSLCFW